MPLPPLPWSRIRLAIRLTAAVVILFGPLVKAGWDVHLARRAVGYPEVTPAAAVAPGHSPTSAAERAARYLSRRDDIVDHLLPEGAGGTRFFEHLDGNDGMAFPGPAVVGLAVAIDGRPWPEAVELHERAHLAFAFLPEQAARLMAALPDPAPDEYAAVDAGEHFAEMAANAWQVIVPPDESCIDGTPEQRLLEAEARVPGTAGFVASYVQHPAFAAIDDSGALLALARKLRAAQLTEWEALWRGIESRRRPDGTFEPWRYRTVREYLEARRSLDRASGTWSGRAAAVVLVPSLTIWALAGR